MAQVLGKRALQDHNTSILPLKMSFKEEVEKEEHISLMPRTARIVRKETSTDRINIPVKYKVLTALLKVSRSL